MANILLGVTGSVAALKTPLLYQALSRPGHAVKLVATQASLYFFDPATIGPDQPLRQARDPDIVVLDEDEWPGRGAGRRYQRDDQVLHISLRRWADVLVVAPLDANTLGKLAAGLADNCLTCVWRAWDPLRPVVLAPAMNTLMWQHPATARQFRQVALDAGLLPPSGLDQDDLVDWINGCNSRLCVVAPESRRLACGDTGPGALAAPEQIARAVEELLNR